jgi:hypothetical protein
MFRGQLPLATELAETNWVFALIQRLFTMGVPL